MAIRAVAFDYGMVLSGHPNAEAYAEMLRITNLPREQFEACYWHDRLDYDAGKLSGIEFWRKFVRDAALDLAPAAIEELNRWDALHWTTYNPAMLAWQSALKRRGLRTAILSNMGDTVLASIESTFDWVSHFDVLVWSYQVGTIKPDPAIYRHLLKELGTAPEETLFLDDKAANVDGALALGIRALQFSTIEKLREDLIASGLDRELPLPA